MLCKKTWFLYEVYFEKSTLHGVQLFNKNNENIEHCLTLNLQTILQTFSEQFPKQCSPKIDVHHKSDKLPRCNVLRIIMKNANATDINFI